MQCCVTCIVIALAAVPAGVASPAVLAASWPLQLEVQVPFEPTAYACARRTCQVNNAVSALGAEAIPYLIDAYRLPTARSSARASCHSRTC